MSGILSSFNLNGSSFSNLNGGSNTTIQNENGSSFLGLGGGDISSNENESVLSNVNGITPNIPNFAESKLHNTYSLDGIPGLNGKPNPSILDLNGTTPSNNYRDNSPSGAQSF